MTLNFVDEDQPLTSMYEMSRLAKVCIDKLISFHQTTIPLRDYHYSKWTMKIGIGLNYDLYNIKAGRQQSTFLFDITSSCLLLLFYTVRLYFCYLFEKCNVLHHDRMSFLWSSVSIDNRGTGNLRGMTLIHTTSFQSFLAC